MKVLKYVATTIVAAFFVSIPADFESLQATAKADDIVPPAIRLQSVATGVSNPVYVTNVGDARLFVVEQDGRIRIFENGAFLATPFLNITTLVNCCGERGLIGLTFHPNYPTSPYFFVHFTSDGDILPDGVDPANGDNIVVRYSVSGNANVADGTSGKTLLVMPQPFSNHNGGSIEFGGDGYLYIAKGDGGSANDPGNRAQNINERLGKILRIDVNQNVNTPPYHGIPPANPFAGSIPGADEVFLIGLRNPWRFSFDRTSGDLWIGDVGQGAREEIDRVPIDASAPGKNLGWRAYEGSLCTNLNPDQCAGGSSPIPHTEPVAEYSHSGGRCSITGGYVYRGTRIPTLVGSYVYADYCTGEIFRLLGTTPELMLDSPHNISSFGEDNSGELYITALSGQIFRIEPLSTAAAATVSGRITTAEGRGIGGVVLQLNGGVLSEPLLARTNPFGYYEFVEVAAGQIYIVTPSAKRYGFTPGNHTLTLLDDATEINFSGIRIDEGS